MATFDGFLIRDSLNDDGRVPSPGYPYSSPDVISHAQVADPSGFFSGNYSTDPSQPIHLGSRLNPIYVRAKNLSANPLSGHYVSVYRASPSLFLRPSLWSGNPLTTRAGETSVALPATVPSGGIGVGQDCFLLDAVNSNLFCLVGIVSATKHPVIPADFATYSDYIEWVRASQNVCGRNLNKVQDFPNRSWEEPKTFSNPSADSVPTLFKVTTSGLPAGSSFGLQCVPLGVSTNWPISAGPVQTASGMTPAHFNGYVVTWGLLPAGVKWPPGASIETKVYVGEDRDGPVAHLAVSLDELGLTRYDEVEGLPEDGILVLLGSCKTEFVRS
ncbi:hypothetical protein KIPE111705_37835 [Kibdelosporangium persicum]|uniref:Peptidase S1 domain-containing protein n=1 Tax=Kibdelosporangium persicum TaxID=2698649 RepID=A0ABX2EWP9_9PSEU|nr:hypothetical protein [Kibdelosporangium persicum]NRN63137.1 hypothetical protein [Kibdelosporangium persicum]